jgi:hypothetical protein
LTKAEICSLNRMMGSDNVAARVIGQVESRDWEFGGQRCLGRRPMFQGRVRRAWL